MLAAKGEFIGIDLPGTAHVGIDQRFLTQAVWGLLGYGYWAVEEKSSGRCIGDIGYADFKRDITPSLDGMPELGWVLASDAHGKGYASEALAAVLAWGQSHFGEHRAACIIAPENLASIRVATKAGFHRWCEAVYHGSPSLIFRGAIFSR